MIHLKVSVVMSVYNEEKYLKQAVDSILGQTFEDFEFIIINDGSTDGTQGILETYNDNRLRIIEQENVGLTRSLNNGLKLAKGDYIARMDGDDISRPERLERQVEFLNLNREIGLVGTFVNHIDENGGVIKEYTFKTTNEEIKMNLWVDCPFCHSSVMFRKDCIEKVGVYREKIGPAEDLDLWFRISEHFDVANIPEFLHKFRIDPFGVSFSRRFDQIRSCMLVRMLADDRKQYGNDSLNLLTYKEITEVLDKLLPRSRKNVRNVLFSNYIYLAEISYVTRMYRQSFKWLSKSILLSPLNQRAWILAPKLILSCLLTEKMVYSLKMLYQKAKG